MIRGVSLVLLCIFGVVQTEGIIPMQQDRRQKQLQSCKILKIMDGLHGDKLITRNGDLHEEWRKAEPSSSETARQRIRRIEAHLDGILDYELPSAENFKNMRHSLREINDKMAAHKFLLDRRTNFGMDDDNRKVSERIDDKYRELEERMPCLTASERTRTRQCKSAFDPNLIAGYATGLSVTNSDQTAELRGRIRTLLCRTRRTAESEDAHTNAARRRREATVK